MIAQVFEFHAQDVVNTISTIIMPIIGQRLGLPSSETTTHLFQQLGIRLWRGNASMSAMCVPVISPTIDGGI